MGAPPTVNQRGDSLSVQDAFNLTGDDNLKVFGASGNAVKRSPQEKAGMFFNWLTGGGLPKNPDPSKIFYDAQKLAPVEQKAGAGMGMSGLFGEGKLVGELAPAIEPIKPVTTLQSGVPYAAPALPKLGGG